MYAATYFSTTQDFNLTQTCYQSDPDNLVLPLTASITES
jgi:cation transporter-like permease